MKVVLDTNVLVAGVFFSGPPATILRAWRDGRFVLMVSPPIMDEYRRVMYELASDFPFRQHPRAFAQAVSDLSLGQPILSEQPEVLPELVKRIRFLFS